jgi:hypothetical protein
MPQEFVGGTARQTVLFGFRISSYLLPPFRPGERKELKFKFIIAHWGNTASITLPKPPNAENFRPSAPHGIFSRTGALQR